MFLFIRSTVADRVLDGGINPGAGLCRRMDGTSGGCSPASMHLFITELSRFLQIRKLYEKDIHASCYDDSPKSTQTSSKPP